MSWLDFANHFLSNQRLHAWSWINRTFSGMIFVVGNLALSVLTFSFSVFVFFLNRWRTPGLVLTWWLYLLAVRLLGIQGIRSVFLLGMLMATRFCFLFIQFLHLFIAFSVKELVRIVNDWNMFIWFKVEFWVKFSKLCWLFRNFEQTHNWNWTQNHGNLLFCWSLSLSLANFLPLIFVVDKVVELIWKCNNVF